jgi:hypothetical protein
MSNHYIDTDRLDSDASYRDGYTDLYSEICHGIPESWDSDSFVVVDYVREIERRLIVAGGSIERWAGER